MTKQWKFYEENNDKAEEIQRKFKIGKLVANIIANRDVGTDEDIRIYLNPTREDFHDPFLFNDMEKAVNRIIKAIDNKEKVLNRARELCIRIREESENPQLIKDAINLELLSLIMDNKPTEVLEILGEDVKTFSQDAELISMSFKLLGNMNKASEITQICIYQNLISLVGNISQQIVLNMDKLDIIEECFKRAAGICELFNLDELHPNTTVNLYLATAQGYAINKQNEKF